MFRVWPCVALMVLGATIVGLSARAEDDFAAETQKKKEQMSALSKETQAGTYYDTAQVPKDLDGFRSLGLAVGNLGRRDPDYRKKHGEKAATDLSGATAFTPKDPVKGPLEDLTEKIYKNQQTPPYFTDLVLNDALNKAAQFQAEYQASIGKSTHDGPDSLDGDSMKTAGDRIKHFRYTGVPGGEITGYNSDATGFPETWMQSDTHFRGWFNIGSELREIGFGIAKGKDGIWYACVVGNGSPPAAAERKSERRGSPPPAKKNPPPPTKKASPPPPPKKVIPLLPKKQPPKQNPAPNKGS
jgi:hypothetical protein